MLSHQELSDRFEIQDLLANYSDVIDSKNFDRLDDFFTPDAVIDYTEAGGIRGNLDEVKVYLAKALKSFSSMQHMLGLPQIVLKGDRASARTILFNPMVVPGENGPSVFFVGLWYVDELIRTEAGWRITSRKEELSYFHNLPDSFKPA